MAEILEEKETQKILLLWCENNGVIVLVRRFFVKAIFILIILFLLFSWGVYQKNWDGKTTEWFSGVFYLPLGIMNGKFFSMKEYLVFQNAMRNFYQKNSSLEFPGPVELQKKALAHVVENTFFRALLKKYNISISKKEAFQKKEMLFEDARFQEESLKVWYNMEEDEFVTYFVMPLLSKERLTEKFGEDELVSLVEQYQKENPPIFFVRMKE